MKQKLIQSALLFALMLAGASIGQAKVEVTKSILGGLTEVKSGKTFSYVLQYRNPSTTIPEFYNVTITDPLPPELEYRGFEGTADVSSVNYDSASHTLTIFFNNPLEDGKTGELEVRTAFKPGVTPDGTIALNSATIDADNSPADTSGQVSITARAANLAVLDKVLLGSSIPLDQDVTYQVRLTNTETEGALNLENVTVVDQLPAGSIFVAATGGGSYDAATHTVTWTTAALVVGKRLNESVTLVYPAANFAVGDRVTNAVSATLTPYGGSATTLTDSVEHEIVVPSSKLFFRKSVDVNRFTYEGKTAQKKWRFDLRNDGNVPLHNVVVSDTIPDTLDITAIRVPKLVGTPAGVNDPVAVYYQTASGGATWQALPGNPYDGVNSSWVNVSALGLGAADYITAVKWDFGTIPVGYQERDMELQSTVLTVDRSGNPVLAGDVIVNDATVNYTDFNGAQSDTKSSSLSIKTPRPVADLDKTASSGNVNDGGLLTFNIKLLNHSLAARELIDPVLADLLDGKFEYVPGSWQVVNKPAGAPDPWFELIDNYQGSGQQLLRWSWTGASAYDLAINESVEVSFQVEVPFGTIFGTINNDAYLVDWGNTDLDPYNGVNTRSDANDLDGDSDSTETIYSNRANTYVNGRASMDSIKWVKGQLDLAESRFPDSGETVPGGLADYRLVVENSGNVPIEAARVLDILPIVGDTGVVDLSPRDTQWVAALAGPVAAPPGVTVYYSREVNPQRPEFKANVPGASDPLWSTTPPATITEARSLYFAFDGVTIQPGELFELSWPMRAPVGTPTDGRIAWNSFGYFGTRIDTGSTLLASEPNKVGIKVMPDNNASYGDFVWLDYNKNGIQDSGEPGLNGIRVDFYEDGDRDAITGGFPDGVRDPATDRHVGFTVTADNFLGEPGYYLFPDLDRGDYYAVFSVPDSYGITTADLGLDDSVDSDADFQRVDGNFIQAFMPITNIEAGEHDRSWDLGLWLPPTSVSIVKTAGPAADGTDLWVNSGSSVTYRYTITNTGDLPLVRLKVTDDVLGHVAFIDGPLAPGASTTVSKTATAVTNDVVNIGEVVGHPASLAGDEIAGAPPVSADDPATVMVYAAIGDFVWYDVNLNGLFDSGESPVPGVAVTLYDGSGNPIATDTTNGSGRYFFDSLLPGDYSLGFGLPAGYLFSAPDQGSNEAKDSDADPDTGRTVVTTLVSSQIDRTWDAGLWKPSSLGDLVWLDLDGDGLQGPGESGVGGIVVNLLDASGAPVLDGLGDPLTTTTDSSGNYAFNNLRPGSYRVEFVVPTTYIFSPQDADGSGVNGADNSDADAASGISQLVNLGSDVHNPRIDAGLIPANPAIKLEKSVSPLTYDTDGESLVYSFVVTNTGNVPLTDVIVTDPLLPVAGGPVSLAVGEVDATTFTGSYTVGLAELNAGQLPNTATVTGTDARTGDKVSDQDDAHATAVQLPALSLSKTGTYVSGAGGCQPLGVGAQFNALIFGDLNASGGDTDARLAVAGDVTINGGYSVGIVIKGDPLPTYTDGTTDIFITGGDLIDGRFGVNGNVVHQGSRTGPVRVMPYGNLTRKMTPITFDADGNVPSDGSGKSFAELESEMQVRSALMGAFAERGVVSITETTGSSGVVALDLVGNDPDLNIFHLDADQISLSSAAFNITVPAGSTTLVNVYGETVAIHGVGMTLSHGDPRMVLFNLVDATSVELSAFAWQGSVLAPYASGNFNGGAIDGRSIFGGNVVTQNGFEFHNFPFNGGICFQIEYTFSVSNTGNVTITDIDIDDPVVPVAGGPIDLDPGESDSTTFTATYLVKASDIVNGAFTNTATVSGFSPTMAGVTASDSDTQTFTIKAIGSGGSSGAGGSSGPPSEEVSNGRKPDLQVNSVVLLPASGDKIDTTGEAFTAVVEVENIGPWKAEGAILRFWNNKPDPAAIAEIGDAEVHLGVMEIGEIRTVTVSGFTAPAVAGIHKLRVFADADGTVDEQSEGNNQLTGTYTVFEPASSSPPAWMKPDFVIQSMQLLPSPTFTSAEFDLVVRITNQGDISGDAGVLGLWETSSSYTSLAAVPDQTVNVGTIAPGQIIELTFPDLRAPDDQGTYHARTIVDLNNSTDEYSTGNNHGGATYTVFPMQARIKPHPDGMQISWDSSNGLVFYVERATSLGGSFSKIAGPLPATSPENTYIDDNLPSGGSVFYRVWGERAP